MTAPLKEPAPASPLPRDDRRANGVANFGFGTALGVGTVALPLVALAAGYDAAGVGLLTASSAVSQLGIRLALPRILRRFPDRTLIVVAGLLLASSYALLLMTTVVPVFLLAQSLQGVARGLFWTGSQTHVVRGTGGTVRSLAQMQILGNLGTLTGPALAGVLATFSLPLALVAGSVAAAGSASVGLLLRRLPPFERREEGSQGGLWRQPDVLVGCLANFSAGGWRSMLGSYVPVILTAAGLGPAVVGVLVALADAASMAASVVLVSLKTGHPAFPLRLGVLSIGAALVLLPVAPHEPVVAGLLLLLGGAGSGLVVVLGPALVTDAVHPEARGEALSMSGLFRAVALLASPAGVALALGVVPLGVAVAGAGVLIAGPPVLLAGWVHRRG